MASALTPLHDDEVENLQSAMRNQALATDQRILASESLVGRSLTCCQGGMLLEVVKLGFVQRMFAFEVLHPRLSDLPDGLPDVLEPLAESIRKDVEARLRKPPPEPRVRSGYNPPELQMVQPLTCSNGARSASSSILPQRARRKPDWPARVDRLRDHVENGQVVGDLYEDLAAVFEALDLGPLSLPRGDSFSATTAMASASSTASTAASPAPDFAPPGTVKSVHFGLKAKEEALVQEMPRPPSAASIAASEESC